ncbi:hypothetical protein MYX76_03150 [Desulfobacterota bacterium AH_259_B03_O07]|nr:hypothetical protein [Desulfobacterota bacterium AH_259_B03_O07]
MDKQKNQGNKLLDEYILGVEDQELKGILLKLKNETRKPDISWDVIKSVLISLKNKDRETLIKILPLIL